MHGLSYGVIRVDTEEKLSVLTVQDVGQVMPGGKGPTGVCVWTKSCEKRRHRPGSGGVSALEAPVRDFLKVFFHANWGFNLYHFFHFLPPFVLSLDFS